MGDGGRFLAGPDLPRAEFEIRTLAPFPGYVASRPQLKFLAEPLLYEVAMPRIPRRLQVIKNHSVHKIWRGHNKEFNLGSPEHKAAYLEFLNDELESEKHESGSQVHAVTLMSNHTHEVFGVEKQPLFSNYMRRHHSRYGAYFNKRQNRSGKVAEDRPKTCLLADSHHEMVCTFYIHANPVRAKLVKDARNYPWSTHRLYAFGKRELWMRNITLPKWYLALGLTMAERQSKYRKLYSRYLKSSGNVRQTFLQQRFFGPGSWQLKLEQRVKNWRQRHETPD